MTAAISRRNCGCIYYIARACVKEETDRVLIDLSPCLPTLLRLGYLLRCKIGSVETVSNGLQKNVEFSLAPPRVGWEPLKIFLLFFVSFRLTP